MSDSKYFTTTKKGELAELRIDLKSDKKEKKKEAVKKIIASMTVGKDVSSLFADVVNCMQTDNLELKKLVYLYLMNYAKSQPDLAILAVNTFSKDCEDPNPLIRALAVRTMGCIRVDKITEYLCEPLRKCLKDEDPYVRKTAAVCVAKLHDINAQLVEDQGFLDLLKELLSDSTPMVVANAVAALAEIGDVSPTAAALTDLDTTTINKLLTALNECTEWGQVFILDSLATYQPQDEQEAQNICERVTPRLSHANAAVVLSAVKVLMKFMEIMTVDSQYYIQLIKKLAPPLVTLLSAEPEIQFVALRNINLVVQKRSDVLKEDIKVFFVKYNDPIYVKLEKLDIMIRLVNTSNIGNVLAELKEYATEVDVDFVRKSVRAIGRCAIKVDSAAERCVSTLVELIQTKVTYVVQEAVIVIKDIFRKYPNQYESIISILCENLDSLDEPEARASMIWILGEYCDRIDNVDELLGSFLENFHDENAQVQLQLLTSIVKLFLKRPSDTSDLVQNALSLATQDSDNPDLRDRGYIYWRLLSTDPGAAKDVVLAEKPTISEETDLLEPGLLDELICHISTLASVYHKPPSAFVEGKVPVRRITLQPKAEPSAAESTEEAQPEQPVQQQQQQQQQQPTVIQTEQPRDDLLIGDLLSLDIPTGPPAPVGGGGAGLGDLDLLGTGLGGLDLTGLGAPAVGGAQPAVTMGGGFGGVGLFGAPATGGLAGLGGLLGTVNAFYTAPMAVLLASAQGKGMEISGTWSRRAGSMYFDMTITNRALAVISDFAIIFNKNSFGLAPAQPLVVPPVLPNQSANASLQVSTGPQVLKMDPLTMVQVAIKNNVDVFYFGTVVPINVYFAEDGAMERKTFLGSWKEIPSTNEFQSTVSGVTLSTDEAEGKLNASNIFTIAKRSVDTGGINQDLMYMSARLVNNIWLLAEFKIVAGSSSISVALKTRAPDIIPGCQEIISKILTN